LTLRAVDQPYEAVVRNYASRHRMRPGITGWAQVNGWRGQTDTIERARTRIEHDIYYIEHWSILFDLQILALTLPAVVAGRNAV
jgi:lipopolysaccharide/colanic/teichoic acid biosynthesis glycosyltransferase